MFDAAAQEGSPAFRVLAVSLEGAQMWVVLAALAAAVAVLGFYLSRLRRARIRREVEAIVAARTKELEDANKALVAMVQKAEAAAESKGSFLAAMSHEIRTPLNGVVGMAEHLGQYPLPPEPRECADIIHHSAQLVLSLVNDILDYTRIESGRLMLNPEPVELRRLLDESLEMLLPLAREKQIPLYWFVDDDVPKWVRLDPLRLKQILVNLLSNAVKFTVEGHVAVRCAASRERDGWRLRFAVEDTGPGIPQHVAERLFQPFEQGELGARRRGGTGLGLVICRRLCQEQQGSIYLESTVGQGTTFFFNLFAAASEPAGRGEPQPLIAPVAQFHVEDPMLRTYLDAGLKALGGGGIDVLDNTEPAQEGDVLAIHSDAPLPSWLANARRLGLQVVWIGLSSPPSAHARGSDIYLRAPFALSQWQRLFLPTPRAHPQPEPVVRAGEEAPQATTPAPAPPTRTALVVDDNAVNVRVAQVLLKRLGWTARGVRNGLEAISELERSRYEIVLMDIRMPGMDGYETTRSIRSNERIAYRPWIIACTAGAMEGERENALNAGMDDYVAKPLSQTELRLALGRASESAESASRRGGND